MPTLATDDGVKLYYEEVGYGAPIVFVHEFGGDHRSWEPQVRHFSRRYRCIAYNARGYPPSDVPEDFERYSQARARRYAPGTVRTSFPFTCRAAISLSASAAFSSGRACDTCGRSRPSTNHFDLGVDARTGKQKQSREGALLGNRLSDGDSLYLFITPNSAKSWRMD